MATTRFTLSSIAHKTDILGTFVKNNRTAAVRSKIEKEKKKKPKRILASARL